VNRVVNSRASQVDSVLPADGGRPARLRTGYRYRNPRSRKRRL